MGEYDPSYQVPHNDFTEAHEASQKLSNGILRTHWTYRTQGIPRTHESVRTQGAHMRYTTTPNADMRGAECVITDGQTLHESLRDVCNEGRLNNGVRIADKTRSTHEDPRGPTPTRLSPLTTH